MATITAHVEMEYLPIVSVNACYGQTTNGRKFLYPEAAQWKNLLRQRFARAMDWQLHRPVNGKVDIKLEAHFPLTKGQKPDGDNFLKLASDAIAEELGIDDHNFTPGVLDVDHKKENGQGRLIFHVGFEA